MVHRQHECLGAGTASRWVGRCGGLLFRELLMEPLGPRPGLLHVLAVFLEAIVNERTNLLAGGAGLGRVPAKLADALAEDFDGVLRVVRVFLPALALSDAEHPSPRKLLLRELTGADLLG